MIFMKFLPFADAAAANGTAAFGKCNLFPGGEEILNLKIWEKLDILGQI